MRGNDHRSRTPIQRVGRTIVMTVAVLALIPLAAAQTTEGGKDAEKATGQAEAPKLKLSTTEWDFGTKWAGEKAETQGAPAAAPCPS